MTVEPLSILLEAGNPTDTPGLSFNLLGLLGIIRATADAVGLTATAAWSDESAVFCTTSTLKPTGWATGTSAVAVSASESVIAPTDRYCYAQGLTRSNPLWTTGAARWEANAGVMSAVRRAYSSAPSSGYSGYSNPLVPQGYERVMSGSMRFLLAGVWKFWPALRIPIATSGSSSNMGGMGMMSSTEVEATRRIEPAIRRDCHFQLEIGNGLMPAGGGLPLLAADLDGSDIRIDEARTLTLTADSAKHSYLLPYAQVVDGELVPWQLDVTDYVGVWFGYRLAIRRTGADAFSWDVMYLSPTGATGFGIRMATGTISSGDWEWSSDRKYGLGFGRPNWEGQEAYQQLIGDNADPAPRGYQLQLWNAPDLDNPWSGTAALDTKLLASTGFGTNWISRTTESVATLTSPTATGTAEDSFGYGRMPTDWAVGRPDAAVAYGPLAWEWRATLRQSPTVLSGHDCLYAIGLYDREKSVLGSPQAYLDAAYTARGGQVGPDDARRYRSSSYSWWLEQACWTGSESTAIAGYPIAVIGGSKRLLDSPRASGLLPAASDPLRWSFFLFSPAPIAYPYRMRWRVFIPGGVRSKRPVAARLVSITLSLFVIDHTALGRYGLDLPSSALGQFYLEAPVVPVTAGV